jgi:glycine C-acetyltransferase
MEFEPSELDLAKSAENFLLPYFSNSRGSLTERVKPFSDYLHESTSKGFALYGREIQGKMGPRVEIFDRITGKVREMVMMGSNNYLGLADHPEISKAVKDCVDRFGTGMGGPPLLNGTSTVHRTLELKLGKLKGKEDVLLYPSGFQANIGWITALARAQDYIICDELHHASLFDGIRLARSRGRVHAKTFRHNDMSHLEEIMAAARSKANPGSIIFVAVEGVYSMDGDLAPLPEIVKLCKKFEALLIVDDAHGTGILGETGGGTVEHFGLDNEVDISMGTFSKSFAVTGGFVAGKKQLIDYLRYFSRAYMFSAHLPQPMAAGISAGIDLMGAGGELRKALVANVRSFTAKLNTAGFTLKANPALVPIIPIMLPAGIDVRKLGKRLHEEGLFCNLIEPPAVAADAQRIRLSVIATHTEADLDFATTVLTRLSKEFGII